METKPFNLFYYRDDSTEWFESLSSWVKIIRRGLFKIECELIASGDWKFNKEDPGEEDVWVIEGFFFSQKGNDDYDYPPSIFFDVKTIEEAKKMADEYIIKMMNEIVESLKQIP